MAAVAGFEPTTSGSTREVTVICNAANIQFVADEDHNSTNPLAGGEWSETFQESK